MMQFEPVYQRQSWLGNLPLLLLDDRFPQVGEIILEMRNDPANRTLIGIFQRMLQYYGEMTSARRAADTRYKSRSRSRNEDGRIAIAREVNAEDAARERDSDPFQQIAAELRERRGATCSCSIDSHWLARLADDDTNEAMVTILYECESCDHIGRYTVSRAEFEAVARMIAGLDD